jgi:hypothetical protein
VLKCKSSGTSLLNGAVIRLSARKKVLKRSDHKTVASGRREPPLRTPVRQVTVSNGYAGTVGRRPSNRLARVARIFDGSEQLITVSAVRGIRAVSLP